MEEDNCAQTALEVMADMLKERGYDYSYAPELEGTSLIYRDKAGNYHDCWGAGSSELVNVPIAVTPEQALSVDDLDGIIDENAKLRELCFGLAKVVKNDDDTFRRLREIAKQSFSYDFIGMYDSSLGKIDQIARFIDSMAELGIEVDG